MKKSEHLHNNHYVLWGGVALIILLSALLGYSYYLYTETKKERSSLHAEFETTKANLLAKESEVEELQRTLEEIQAAYTESEEKGAQLLEELTEEKGRNEEFEEQIEDISGTVGKLDKLSKMDPELLHKYSKVYFLNEHYMPGLVKAIPDEYRLKAESEYIHAQVEPNLMELLDDARDEGISLYVASGYRSYDEQKNLKGAYTVIYGAGANAFSADQGYSEHQLGTTVDFTTKELGGGLTGFEYTPAYTWLEKNAHKYGFVLSYPKGNTYYMYEPWHWRYVGEDLADDLHDQGKYFYDLDQREIDKYLIDLFD